MNWLNVQKKTKHSTLMEPKDLDLNLMWYFAAQIQYPTEQSDKLLNTLPVFSSLLEEKKDGPIDFEQTRVVVLWNAFPSLNK